MSAKKKTDESNEATAPVNPFTADMTRVSPEFNMATLLENFETQKAENEKRKVGINERIIKARQNIARIEAMVSKLLLKTQQESGLAWENEVAKPLAEQIQNVFPNATMDMTSIVPGNVTMTLGKKGISPDGKLKNIDCISLTLVMQEDGFGIRDYSKNTEEYPAGSLGAISGLNHPVVPVDKQNPVGFLVDWLLK